MISFVDIEEARERIREQIYLSPFPHSETISQMTGNRIFFKLENLQLTGSFKERGALNRLLMLSGEEAHQGVIAASAGNHGMAVAYHSRRLHLKATIVMPISAPLIKVTRVRQYGAETLLHGNDYDAAYTEAVRLSRASGPCFISAFDDLWVIAGQGTIGIELYEQNPDLEVAVVPVGGGGLIAGIALALKTLLPKIRIIGVQAEAVPSMKVALDQGAPAQLGPATTIADGIAVRAVGALPFELVRRYVDEIVTVNEREIANAVLLLLEIEKTVAEGAAAVPLAALVNKKIAVTGKNVGLIVTGGNIDMNLISRIIETGLVQDGRLSRFAIVISDRPGSLARLAQRVADLGANILQITHSRSFGQMAIGETEVELILETAGPEHIERIYSALTADKFKIKSAG
ncbi:MAG TPA: threonine ammonia-lyase [Candidatus Binatia bacterium]|jgi:threonine dehydratase|nr:threonine ammonia-lyase [Candidatus Binatia bacterium]